MAAHCVVFLTLLALPCAASFTEPCGTCGKGCSQCENVDEGSCGNACCKVFVQTGLNTSLVVELLNTSLAKGGPDGHYTQSFLVEGVKGFADLRPYKQKVDFIGQATHMTSGAPHYNDTIDITVTPTAKGGAYISLFSISQIGGAFGDQGQNYKNLIMIIRDVSLRNHMFIENKGHVDRSCPAP
mmetsp:Transcript_18111/g.30251  ORF Transcript_18111/g.30251 Transcript_18111/m.30251 type:complete len:184 (+) Transcript_18111:31-582(+)